MTLVKILAYIGLFTVVAWVLVMALMIRAYFSKPKYERWHDDYDVDGD